MRPADEAGPIAPEPSAEQARRSPGRADGEPPHGSRIKTRVLPVT